MNYSKVFYWLCVADNARTAFGWFAGIFTTISVITTVIYFFGFYTSSAQEQTQEDKDIQRNMGKWMRWCYPFMVLFWMLLVLTPDKKDALLIVAGGGVLNYLASDSTAKSIPHELLTFAKTEIQNMGESAKVDLDIKSQKDKILDAAKMMTTQELLDKMKVDSNFAKIVLNK